MISERQYFPECGEWSPQEREFASRVVQSIGLVGWHSLLRTQRLEGKAAFIRNVFELWPNGAPPTGEL